MNFESKRVIMSSGYISAERVAVKLPRHLPEPLSTATPLNQNMTDRLIPDAATKNGSRWFTMVKMIFSISAESKGHGGRFLGQNGPQLDHDPEIEDT